MSGETVAVHRPQRWDHPLTEKFEDVDLHWLMRQAPFSRMDPADFPEGYGVREVLRNDSRIVTYSPGDLVQREGLYSGSAFLVLDGSVRAFNQQLAISQNHVEPTKKLSYWQALKEFWRTSSIPEKRVVASSVDNPDQLGVRSANDQPRIFIQDISAVLEGYQSEPLGAGELFGELAAISRAPSHYTIVAETESSLLEIRWQGLRLLRRSAVFREYLDTLFRSNSLKNQLQENPLLEHVPDFQIEALCRSAELVSLGDLEWFDDYRVHRKLDVQQQILSEPQIAEEGQPAENLLLIRSGFARESVRQGAGNRTLAYLGKGHVFGLSELTTNLQRRELQPPLPYQTSLRAVGFVDLIQLPRKVVYESLLPFVRSEQLPGPIHPVRYDELGKFQSLRGPTVSGQSGSNASMGSLPTTSHATPPETAPISSNANSDHATSLMEFLVDSRLVNGQQTMVIDTMRCTRCDDCVKGCAATHDGNPRFRREGPKFDRWMFAQACMHCVDPVCMLGCPTGAIHRDRETGVVAVNPSTCIGCSTCSNSCPYDNIVMVEIRDGAGRKVVDEQKGLPILQATKCDLCQTQPNGPACVAACPHDALLRIDLSNPAELNQIAERRA